MTLPLFIPLLLLLLAISAEPETNSSPCPYDIESATSLIPPDCYANATRPSSTSCCWYVIAAYIYSAAAHANLTGIAFLPSHAATSCSSNYNSMLLRHGLARPSLLQPNGSCAFSYSSTSLAAGRRPCLFGMLSSVLSTAPSQISNATRFCSSGSAPDLSSEQSACTACQNTIVYATGSLSLSSKSKDYVSCGMAVTIGVWSQSYPSLDRFRSFFYCMVQVLEDLNTLDKHISTPDQVLRTDHSQTLKIVAGSTAAGLVSLVGILLLVLAMCRSKLRRKCCRVTNSEGHNYDSAFAGETSPPLPIAGLYIFTKAELKQATNGFDNRLFLGEGAAGKVYLGKLPSGQHVAVKRIYRERKIVEFYREVEVLAKFRHKNLTTLLGYCVDDRDNHALVYEYMPGGNLSRALFHGELTWRRRLQIATDVAEGLVYLHEFPGGAVVHRDVKPTNVLLSESGIAKLSDFGVSRMLSCDETHLSTEVRGTRGYVDPESFSLGQVSESSDVYSFGIVLLELVTGQHAVVPTPSGGAESIVHMAECAMTECGGSRGSFTVVESIVDPRLGPWDQLTLDAVFGVAYRCVRPCKNERPRMTEVLTVLRSALTDLESREGNMAAF